MTKRNKLERGFHRFRAHVVLGTRSRARLVDRLARQHTERDRDRKGGRELGEGSRDRVREHIEVSGLSSYQAAERHHGVEPSGAREHRDGGGQLERAGDLELLDLCACREGDLDRALGERAGNVIVPARPHDGDARTAIRILHPGRSLPRGRHLPQSSPRMQHRWATR
jgi:hypothetical protein